MVRPIRFNDLFGGLALAEVIEQSGGADQPGQRGTVSPPSEFGPVPKEGEQLDAKPVGFGRRRVGDLPPNPVTLLVEDLGIGRCRLG